MTERKATLKSVKYGLKPDVVFVFPQYGDATIHAEKFQLANESDVFKTHFTSENWNNSDPIEISDISFEIFNIMMKFIYGKGEDSDVTDENRVQILYATRKYLINDLTYKCIKFMPISWNFFFFNDLEALYILSDSGLRSVGDYLENWSRQNATQIIPNMTRFDTYEPQKRLLKAILESPVLHCTELELYKAVLQLMMNKYKGEVYDEDKWRSELGSLIYLIRFPTMTLQELTECCKRPTLLTKEQVYDLQLWVQKKISSDTVFSFSISHRLVTKSLITQIA
ncbi:BTB/POZ domain-containing protein 6-like isoform X2 [Lutzomyia longipalpis]|nr:BTB/POZ domain-containing protein 6-like isoform X2 [Lutzomyia longipalpis]